MGSLLFAKMRKEQMAIKGGDAPGKLQRAGWKDPFSRIAFSMKRIAAFQHILA